jgi:hypothetical protein
LFDARRGLQLSDLIPEAEEHKVGGVFVGLTDCGCERRSTRLWIASRGTKHQACWFAEKVMVSRGYEDLRNPMGKYVIVI